MLSIPGNELLITMTGCRRPKYTQQVATAVAKCRGIENCEIVVFCEPNNPAVPAVWDSWTACPIAVHVHKKRQGLNKNTLGVLTHAYARKPKYVLHLEDDTVPSPDALEYYLWALKEFGARDDVFTIAGYNKPKERPTESQTYEARFKSWFTCWGWAATYVRLGEILEKWSVKNPKSFAWRLNRGVRKNRVEVHPQLSRIQNIGELDGENGRSASWIRAHHHVPFVAGDIPAGAWKLHPPTVDPK